MNRERVGLFAAFPMNREISTAIPHAKSIAVKKSLCRVVNFNSQFARKLTTLEFNDKLTIYCAFASWCEKKVREGTNHGEN